MLRLKTTASVFSRSISIIPARLGSNYSKPPRTKAYLLKGANFSQPSLYALSAKDTSALVEDDLVTPRPSFEQLKPWTAKRRANAAALKTFLRKHEGASPEDLHRIHRSRGFLQSIQRSGANWQAALATLQRMQAEPEGADVHAVGAAISVCAKAGRWQEAIALLEGMEAHGLEPNAVVFTAAITACGRAKQWKKALELFHTMEKRGLPLPTASFNAAISAAGSSGRWVEALGLLDLMDHYGAVPDVVTFGAAISACAKGGQWQKALTLLDVAQGCGVAPNLVCLNSAISACARGGEWQRALDLLASMPARSLNPDLYTLNGAIDACAKAGRADEAMQLLRNMQSQYGVAPNVKTFGAACNAFAKAGHWQKALQLLDELEKATNANDKVLIDVTLVGAAINACSNAASASSNRPCNERQAAAQAALKLVQSMEVRFGFKPNAAVVGAAIGALDGGAHAAATIDAATEAARGAAGGETTARGTTTAAGTAKTSATTVALDQPPRKTKAANVKSKTSPRLPDLTAILAMSRALDESDRNNAHVSSSSNSRSSNIYAPFTSAKAGQVCNASGFRIRSSNNHAQPSGLDSSLSSTNEKISDFATPTTKELNNVNLNSEITAPSWSEDDYANAAADLTYEARTQWDLFPRAWPRRLAAVGHARSSSGFRSEDAINSASNGKSTGSSSGSSSAENKLTDTQTLDDYVEIDLHECPAALARSVLRCLLRDLEDVYAKHTLSNDDDETHGNVSTGAARKASNRDLRDFAAILWPLVDIYVVTGRGKSLNKLPLQPQHQSQQQGNSTRNPVAGEKLRKQQSAVLPSAMRQWLKNVRGPRVSRVVSNTGCFVLTKADLEAWLKAKQAKQ